MTLDKAVMIQSLMNQRSRYRQLRGDMLQFLRMGLPEEIVQGVRSFIDEKITRIEAEIEELSDEN